MAEQAFEAKNRQIAELQEEKEKIDPSCVNALRLLDKEIARVQSGVDHDKMLELHNDKPSALHVRVRLPVKEYPKINFAGRLIGAKGSVMRQFQERTGTKLCVFGRGSMSDKAKEEELRQQGGKYSHLNEEMHVKLEVRAHPVEAYRVMSNALHELRNYLGPEGPENVNGSYPAGGVAPAGGPPAMGPGPGAPAYGEPWMGAPGGYGAAPVRQPYPGFAPGATAAPRPTETYGAGGWGASSGGGKAYPASHFQQRTHPYQDGGVGRGQKPYY